MKSMVDKRDHRTGERGVVLLVTAITMLVLLSFAAIVTDLGLQRVMRRSNQTLVDVAALAAGPALAADSGPNGRAGCEDAVRYLRLNSEALTHLAVDCASLPTTCDSPTTAPVAAVGIEGKYRVAVTYPVADAMIADSRVNGGTRSEDGEACERLHIAVERVEPAIFGKVVGHPELRSRASAVVRQVAAQNRRVPSMWLLDPHGCTSLSVQGGSQVTVGTPTMAGLISADSDGSACTGNTFTLDVGGSGSLLRAIPDGTDPPAMLSLHAMTPGQTSCSGGNPHACDPADIANGTLRPQPTRQPWRATRAPIDHAFNCRTSYPTYHGIALAPCERGAEPYIDQLRAAVGPTGIPPGFQRWTSSNTCNAASGATTVTGNWVVDCPTFRIGNGSDVTFAGGNVVFDGAIAMSGGSLQLNTGNPQGTLTAACQTTVTLCLSQSSSNAAWAYMRNGNLDLTGGTLIAKRTAIYQHNGYFRMSGGSPPQWSAPAEGPFAGLSVWSELPSNRYQINGGASMQLEGVFFTPYANPFTLNGGSPFLPQRAQFVSYRAAIAGGAVLTLSPNSIHAISIPAPPVALVR